MYQTPELTKFGTFREITLQGRYGLTEGPDMTLSRVPTWPERHLSATFGKTEWFDTSQATRMIIDGRTFELTTREGYFWPRITGNNEYSDEITIALSKATGTATIIGTSVFGGELAMTFSTSGFLAAFREATGLPPLVAATFGAILTTWVTFLPCFLWIFAGAPFIERLRGNRALSAALSAITAAVVGVILNLAVWFGIHTLFEQVREVPFAAGTIDLPVLTSVNWPALALAVGAILAMFRFKAGMLPVLGVCSVLGAAYVMII